MWSLQIFTVMCGLFTKLLEQQIKSKSHSLLSREKILNGKVLGLKSITFCFTLPTRIVKDLTTVILNVYDNVIEVYITCATI